MGEPRVPVGAGEAEGRGLGGARQVMWRGRAPQVGAVEVAVALGQPVVARVSAGGLSLDAGGGVEVSLPDLDVPQPLRVSRVEVGWDGGARVEVRGEPGLVGPLEEAALGAALGWALGRLGWRGGEAWLEGVLQGAGLKRDKRGMWTLLWRGLANKTLLRLSVSSQAIITARVDGGGVEVGLSPGLRVVGPGLELRVGVARYRWGEGVEVLEGPEEEGPRHGPRWCRRALLGALSWAASQWVRCQLPYAMRQAGYDWFEDPARLAQVAYLVGRFGGGSKGASASRPGAQGGGGEWLAKLRLDGSAPLRLPAGAEALWRGAVGPWGEVALCVAQGGGVAVRRTAQALEVIAEGGGGGEGGGGLWLAVGGLEGVEALRVMGARLDLGSLRLTVETSPPLGPVPRALLARAFEAYGRGWVERAVAEAWGLGGLDGGGALVIASQALGSAGVLGARLGAQDALTVRYTAAAVEVEASEGLEVEIAGLDFLPPLRLLRLRYETQTAKLSLVSEPEARGFEDAILTQLVRYRALPHLPVGLLGWRAPSASLPLSALRASWPLALVDVDIPVLGRLEVRIQPSDTLRVRLSDALWTVQSAQQVLLIAPDIDLSLTVSEARVDLRTNTLALGASLEVAGYGAAFLMRLLERFGWPPLKALVALPTPGQPWTLYSAPDVMGGLSVVLDPGDPLTITRAPTRLSVEAAQGLTLHAGAGSPLGGAVRVQAVALDLPAGALTVQTQPALGALTQEVAQRLLQQRGPAALNPTLGRLGVAALAPSPWAEPPPLRAPVTLYEGAAPVVGRLKALLDAVAPVTVSLDARQLRLSSQGALWIALPDLALLVNLKALSISFGERWRVTVETTPPLGALERRVIEGQVRALLQPMLAAALPPHPQHKPPSPDDDVLLVVGQGQPWGPVLVCGSHDAPLTVSLTARMLTMHAGRGLLLRGPALEGLLPSFRLGKLEYALGVGQVSLDVHDIAQTFYHEDHDVGALSEQLIEHALKALVAPKLPPLAHQLGVVGFDEDEAEDDLDDEEGVGLLRVPLGDALGEVAVSMAPADVVRIGFNGQEVILEAQEGLWISLRGLRFQCRIHQVRYHLVSGEVCVDKLGQLENALIEAVLAKRFPHRVVDGESFSLLGAFLQALPLHPTQGVELFSLSVLNVGMVRLFMDPMASIRLSLSASELRLSCEPGLLIDGPGFANLRADGFLFSFSEGTFKLFIRRNNPLAGLLSVSVRALLENRLNAFLRPYLPPAMQQPGYSLARDTSSADTIASFIANLSGQKPKPKK